jgi:hypothetical protein
VGEGVASSPLTLVTLDRRPFDITRIVSRVDAAVYSPAVLRLKDYRAAESPLALASALLPGCASATHDVALPADLRTLREQRRDRERADEPQDDQHDGGVRIDRGDPRPAAEPTARRRPRGH